MWNKQNSILNYTCGRGYYFSTNCGMQSPCKSVTIQCMNNRLWYPALNPGLCQLDSCPTPWPPVANATTTPLLFGNGTLFDLYTTITYQCLYGWVIQDMYAEWENTVTITCIGNQTWSAIPNECIRKIFCWKKERIKHTEDTSIDDDGWWYNISRSIEHLSIDIGVVRCFGANFACSKHNKRTALMLGELHFILCGFLGSFSVVDAKKQLTEFQRLTSTWCSLGAMICHNFKSYA